MRRGISIVGAGLAGTIAARTLRDEGYEEPIFLFGDEPEGAYDRPALSKSFLLGSDASPPPILEPGWAAANGVELLTDAAVSAIDPHTGSVSLRSGLSITSDYIILATGARARSLRIPGGQSLPSLRTTADARALRTAIRPDMTLVILGGGLIGCEIATTARKMGANVIVIEAAGELLVRVLGEHVGAWCRAALEDLGVELLLNAKVESVEDIASGKLVRLEDGRNISADLVLACVGAEPADDLAVRAGLSCSRGVDVDALGRTASPRLLAIGDVAAWPLRNGTRRSLETYLNSQSQAIAVANTLLDRGDAAPQVPRSWTEIAGHQLQMIGEIAGPGTFVTRQEGPNGKGCLFRIHGDRVCAAISIDASRTFAVAARLVESNRPVNSSLLADPNTDPRELLKATKKESVA